MVAEIGLSEPTNKGGSQCSTCHIILRHHLATIVAVEKQ